MNSKLIVFQSFSLQITRCPISGRSKEVAENYGWSLLIYRLAETKLFDVAGSGKDSIQCAEEAELYRAFHFLSSRNALEKLNEPKK